MKAGRTNSELYVTRSTGQRRWRKASPPSRCGAGDGWSPYPSRGLPTPDNVSGQANWDAARPYGENIQERKPARGRAPAPGRDGQSHDGLSACRGDLGVDLVREVTCPGNGKGRIEESDGRLAGVESADLVQRASVVGFTAGVPDERRQRDRIAGVGGGHVDARARTARRREYPEQQHA